ncbi:hypothetical protein MJL22_27630, partial [Salmonella enterica subsp. enterica serovar Montevideo]|nr:hypothetical protein [Salmonella enterica subsp. enterica serovar Montevideo]
MKFKTNKLSLNLMLAGSLLFEAYDKYTAIMNSAEYIDAITKTINLLYRVNLDEIQLTNPFK